VASFDELARSHTRLEGSALGHLRRLVASWGLLADFCFADLLLYVPVAGGDGSKFVILGQIRPTTSQTLYREDQVGRVMDEVERPLVARAQERGESAKRGWHPLPEVVRGSSCQHLRGQIPELAVELDVASDGADPARAGQTTGGRAPA